MLGVYNYSGGSLHELALARALHRLAEPAEPIVRGPLAIFAGNSDSPLRCADVDGISCVIDGLLYNSSGAPPSPARPSDDAATVAKAYQREGTEGMCRLRGRYAAAIWDASTSKGALICDLLATRQLFGLCTDGALIFATELPELLALAPRTPSPDVEALATWIATGTCPEGRTFFEGVLRLGPGELFPLGRGRPEPLRYWAPTHSGTTAGTLEEHAHRLRGQLMSAVGKRLSSSYSAVILSGGVDSSVVTAVAAKAKPHGAHVGAYSAVFPGAEYDEMKKIRTVTAKSGVSSSMLEVEPQGALRLALEFVREWQTPLPGPNALVDITATRAAANDGAAVVLDGQTGDELFGFSKYVIADRLRRGRLLAAASLAGQWPSGRRTSQREKLRILYFIGLRGAMPDGLEKYVRRPSKVAHDDVPLLLPGLQTRKLELEQAWSWKRNQDGPLWWRSLADTLVTAPHRELRMSYLRQRAASAGTIADSPLYDVDLIESTLRVPPEIAFDSRFTRPLVREAMRGLLPEEVRLQQKKADFTGFALKVMSTGPDASGIQDLLLAPDAEINAYVDRDWVTRKWKDLRAGRTGGADSPALWRMMAAECWLRAQANPAFPDEMLSRGDILAPSARIASNKTLP